MNTRYVLSLAVVLACAGLALAADETSITVANAGFETWSAVTLNAAGLYNNWKLGDKPEVPADWSLNGQYPGQIVRVEGSADGTAGAHVLLRRTPAGSAHVFQMLKGLQPNTWYRVTVAARGGKVMLDAYQYAAAGGFRDSASLAQGASADQWRDVTGYYLTPGTNWSASALALSVGEGQQVEVDNVRVEPAGVPAVAPGSRPIALSTETMTLALAPSGLLQGLTVRKGTLELAAPSPLPLLSAVYHDTTLQACGVTQEGDRLRFLFPEKAVQVVLKVKSAPTHLYFAVERAVPEDLQSIMFSLPLQRQEKSGWAFNATYGSKFGLSLLSGGLKAGQRPSAAGNQVFVPRIECTRQRGIVGASWLLVGAPGREFKPALMAAEKAAGLPCPLDQGKWLREGEMVRRSYLFAAPVVEQDIEALIDYAKIGGFGTIIFLKDSWLANHGHYDVNRSSFPQGLASLKAAVAKIHQAGLDAGVHVFGPSISPNDPYVTPVPDRRLATFPCPPLLEALDEKSTTLTLTEAPNLPPRNVETQAFPGRYLRIGDEIVRYGPAQEGPPWKYTNCQRGALGTKAAAHPAGTKVESLLTMWGFFLVDPDSTLADEMAANFARVFNACKFDFAYFDASDGSQERYLDTRYYLDKLHLTIWRAIGRDVLYQTSMGTGSGLMWHIVPRSASADGHGDLKGYLDERWPGILGMGNNLTKADVGWYYWFKNCRPDQIEYICAKVLGIDGSISLETCRKALESLPQSRQMMEMIGRWERCRRERFFPASVREKLCEPKRDFKLFPDGKGWKLYRAVYEEPRSVDVLDGAQNAWVINNDRPEPCLLGLEIVRSAREVALGSYEAPGAKPLNLFDDSAAYKHSAENAYEKFVQGEGKQVSADGVVRNDVTHACTVSTTESRTGQSALVYEAENKGSEWGWCAIGRHFTPTQDWSTFQGLGLWIKGDGKGEALRLQLRDSRGRNVDTVPTIDFQGWRLHTFAFPSGTGFDFTRVEYLLVYFNNIPSGNKVRLVLDGLKLLPALNPVQVEGTPVLTVNGRPVTFPVTLKPGESLTNEGVGETMLWPRGMTPGQVVKATGVPLTLQPGENRIELSWGPAGSFPAGVDVMLYRLWPIEK